MKKFLFGFAAGIFFVGLVFVALIAAAITYAGNKRPTVAANSTLVLQLEGDLPEQMPVDLAIPFLDDQQPLSIVEAWQMLRAAAMIPTSRPSCWSPVN